MAALFRHITAGVYVAGVAVGSKRDAFTASSVAQASYQPLMISIAVNPAHRAYALLRQSEAFALSVLGRDRIDLATHSGRPASPGLDKLWGQEWLPARQGAPILSCAIAYFDCIVCGHLHAGDHEIVLGMVTDGAILNDGSRPLIYAETGDLDRSSELFPDGFSAP